MTNHHFFRAVGQLFRLGESLPPVPVGKRPVCAFLAGFCFGPIGAGVYLDSWPDFAILLTAVVLGCLFTVGLGAPFFWILCGVYAAFRVVQSNRQHKEVPSIPEEGGPDGTL